MAYIKRKPGDIIADKYLLLEITGKDKSGYLFGKFNCPYCNNIFISRIADVSKGHTRSCGCLGLQAKSETGKKNMIDYTGQQFGKIKVICRSDKKNTYSNNVYWQCVCECGKHLDISSANIKNIQSCGCLQSKGEYKINQILSNLQIPFESQKTFATCKINGNSLRFDYFLPSYNILIEYDGIQHFTFSNSGWDTESKFLKTQQYDEFKTEWCKENSIPLLRIPYTDLSILTAEYLLQKIGEIIQ